MDKRLEDPGIQRVGGSFDSPAREKVYSFEQGSFLSDRVAFTFPFPQIPWSRPSRTLQSISNAPLIVSVAELVSLANRMVCSISNAYYGLSVGPLPDGGTNHPRAHCWSRTMRSWTLIGDGPAGEITEVAWLQFRQLGPQTIRGDLVLLVEK